MSDFSEGKYSEGITTPIVSFFFFSFSVLEFLDQKMYHRLVHQFPKE